MLTDGIRMGRFSMIGNERLLTNGWQILKFSECIKQLNTGLNPRNHFSLGHGSLKYITAKNLTQFGTIDFSKCDFIDEQAKRIKKGTNVENQQKICDLVPVLKKALYDGNIDVLGEVLNQNWNLKKSLASGISNDRLDDIYKKALEKGATGGKLLGAGGSGFFLFYVPRQNHKQFEEFSQNYKVLDFKFEDEGSTIIYKV